jgi:hypothetical protein
MTTDPRRPHCDECKRSHFGCACREAHFQETIDTLKRQLHAAQEELRDTKLAWADERNLVRERLRKAIARTGAGRYVDVKIRNALLVLQDNIVKRSFLADLTVQPKQRWRSMSLARERYGIKPPQEGPKHAEPL